MGKLPLIYYPDPLLGQQCAKVTKPDSQLSQLIAAMTETMYEAEGIGLAAPQVGELIALTVIDVSEERNQPLVLVNPEVIASSGKVQSEEGCLSIPGYREVVPRTETVEVRYQDCNLEVQTIEATGLLAICLQHEIDHLNGKLFIDYLTGLKKQMFKKWHKKNNAV